VHDSERLIRRILELQSRLGEATLDNPNVPSFLRWQLVEPYTVTPESLQDDGYEGAAFRPLIAIASYVATQTGSEDGLEVTPSLEIAGESDNEKEGIEDGYDDGELVDSKRGYIALLPVANGSTATWPVVIIEPQKAIVVASNLRDYLATEVMTAYEAPTEDRSLWLSFLNRLWVDLRLGIADATATSQRNAMAAEASENWLSPLQ
jgi:hypothetical protein